MILHFIPQNLFYLSILLSKSRVKLKIYLLQGASVSNFCIKMAKSQVIINQNFRGLVNIIENFKRTSNDIFHDKSSLEDEVLLELLTYSLPLPSFS